ncbi:MAG: ribosome small subunit-dependent GTPase A [Lentimicrobiaceae bacterium]|jgi:ribosome biogenesis GTPase|nr:ribosome small subunit-dependent GTPase A [Lentimicrobiaceae bacterium]MCP4909954.1 ribosome small subunit-dependent GTPase A [Bacteroidota bacterium]MBT3454907.1 ribosome small subunit-dependent GTPase A [Lentimicrobiaceae bacterium]MBT3818467.1 ribosome small subunit-dependent GTPase A [Lentimicrobiaceae bacterium]MBT4060835.1 ribosome small subunit-dependent GTPase A [Lentimicrobiaceae bacterium]
MTSKRKGRVQKSTGSWYSVATDTGQIYQCRLKGVFRNKGIKATNPIAVGDIVDITIDSGDGTGLITNIHPRTNYLIRKATKLSKVTHVIASNVEQVIIIVSLVQPRTSTGFIDRILTTAEAYHIPSVIVFNKTDLYDKNVIEKLQHLRSIYKKIGYKTIKTSAKTGDGLQDLKHVLKDKISLLSGHSGVGKSALINKLDPNLNLKTGQISDYHLKGMHTTTFATMFQLSFGGNVIDTPGIKEFGLVEFEKVDLGQRFPEIRCLMKDCKFNNCVHLNEPGCAVITAAKNGEIAEFRYENYLNMLNSI